MISDALATVIGYVGADPRVTNQAGKSVMNFSLAVNRRVRNEQVALWCRVELWNPRPELVALLRKGAYIRVVGSLFPDNWRGKDGTAHQGFVIRYPQILVLTGKGEAEDAPPAPEF